MPTYEDIAFKVIVKNDGISDIIMKTLMLKGEAGGTIASIEKTSSVGVVDTYTITLNDGTTTTFEVTNGSNIASIEKTASSGLIDTYTVTLTNGDTSTFEVKNGEDAQLYELPQNCVVGYDVDDALVNYDGLGTHVQLEDANGIKSIHLDGMTYQKSLAGINLFNVLPYADWLSVGSYILEKNILPENTNLIMSFTDNDTSIDVSGIYLGFCENSYSGGSLTNYNWCLANGNIMSNTTNVKGSFQFSAIVLWPTTEETYNKLFARYKIQIEVGSTATPYEPYCGGKPSPSPSYPQEIEGIGELQSNNTYSFDLGVEDTDGNMYTITVSGLSHPILSGDSIDIFNGVVRRNTGWKVLDGSESWNLYPAHNGYYLQISDMMSGNQLNGKSDRFIKSPVLSDVENSFQLGFNNSVLYMIQVNISGVTDLTSWETWLSNNNTTIVYPLTTATEESVTISGDIGIIQRMRGMFIDIYAPDHTSQIWGQYYEEPEFPDGYEEIDFPLDDMFYYQDGEYIDFPSSWGFVMGYVFDANNIRFVMNATKQLKEGMIVAITRSADLSLNTYAGAGDVGILSGFSANSVSWIPELGQIQINLTTSQPHGLTPNMLLGARVATGVLRIIFEEET